MGPRPDSAILTTTFLTALDITSTVSHAKPYSSVPTFHDSYCDLQKSEPDARDFDNREM